MLLSLNLALILASVHVLLVPATYSAPTSHTDGLSPPLEDLFSQHVNTPPAADFRKLNASFVKLNRRDAFDTWETYHAWKKAVIAQELKMTQEPIPAEVPIGEKLSPLTKSSGRSRSRSAQYKWERKDGNLVTQYTVALVRRLVNGGNSIVYEGSWVTNSAKPDPVAVKETQNEKNLGEMLKGLELQQMIPSKYAVRVIDRFITVNEQGKPNATFAILELVEGPSLNFFYDRPQKDVNVVMLRASEAVEVLHNQGIMHRDLKPDNFIFDQKYKPGGRPRLIDFDLATTEKKSNRWGGGTIGYIAPEIFLLQEYGPKVDVYSMGFIWLELSNTKLRNLRVSDRVTRELQSPEAKRQNRNGVQEVLWQTPEGVKEVLKKNGLTFSSTSKTKPNSDQMLDLVSRTLCGPDDRISISEFVSGLRKLVAQAKRK